MNLYKTNEIYEVVNLNNKKEWLGRRKKGIGASDASALIGLSKWKSLNELWREKTSKEPATEITNSSIERGIKLEPVIREYFKKTWEEYRCFYKKDTILISKKRDWQLYSPDGLVIEKNSKKKGILEIKTTTIQNGAMLDEWKEQIPQNYYIQCLHALLVTEFDFVVLVANLRFAWSENKDFQKDEIRLYTFTKEECIDDLEWLLNEEIEKWEKYFVNNKEPSLTINFNL